MKHKDVDFILYFTINMTLYFKFIFKILVNIVAFNYRNVELT